MLISKISFCSNYGKKTDKKAQNNPEKKVFSESLSDSSKCTENSLNTGFVTSLIQYKNKNSIHDNYFDILFKQLMKNPFKISLEFLSDVLSESINQDIIEKFHLYEHFNGVIISDIERYKLNDGTCIDKKLYDLVLSGKLETSKWHSLLEDSHMQVTNDDYNLLFGEINGKNILNISPLKSNLIYSISFAPDGQFERIVISNGNKIIRYIDSNNDLSSSDSKISMEQCFFLNF